MAPKTSTSLTAGGIVIRRLRERHALLGPLRHAEPEVVRLHLAVAGAGRSRRVSLDQRQQLLAIAKGREPHAPLVGRAVLLHTGDRLAVLIFALAADGV